LQNRPHRKEHRINSIANELDKIEQALAKAREALASKPCNDQVDLAEAIQDNIGPETVSILAAKLKDIERTDDPVINDQLKWFADMLAELVGGWDSAIQTARQYGIE